MVLSEFMPLRRIYKGQSQRITTKVKSNYRANPLNIINYLGFDAVI